VLAHTLEITFDNLVVFNAKFAALKEYNLMFNKFNVIQDDLVIKDNKDNPDQENSDIFNHSLKSEPV